MDALHAPLLPQEPLAQLEADYGQAVLHIAWDWCRDSDVATLLFAFIELLPHEVPPPEDRYDFRSPEFSCSLGGSSKHTVYRRHAVMPAADALAWYEACRDGTVQLPDDELTRGVELVAGRFAEDPPWPTLITNGSEDDWGGLAFCPEWMVCPRTHHLLPSLDFDPGTLWTEKEENRARAWLEDRLHFDIATIPEYWGSVHLVAPNPTFRALRWHIERAKPSEESVLVLPEPRAGRSLECLEFHLRERMPWGTTGSQRWTAGSSATAVDFGRTTGALSVDVFDPERGYLYLTTRAAPFVRSIGLNIAVAKRVRVMRDGEAAYEVTKSGLPELTSVTHDASQQPPTGRLYSAYVARNARLAGVEYGQKWFRDQKDEARRVVRSLIRRANRSALLIDPYLGAAEVVDFALATSRHDMPVRLLTSAEHLKRSDGSRENGEALLSVINQLEGQTYANSMDARVMTGARPDIHDRFLVVDDKVWLLGSSLNEFGSRGTMMVAVPDPGSVLGDLERAWGEATALDSWIRARREAVEATE